MFSKVIGAAFFTVPPKRKTSYVALARLSKSRASLIFVAELNGN